MRNDLPVTGLDVNGKVVSHLYVMAIKDIDKTFIFLYILLAKYFVFWKEKWRYDTFIHI